MKITNVRSYQLTGPLREGLALFETPRGGLAPFESTPHRMAFTEIETDEGLIGLALGGSRAVVDLGQRLIGEDPMRIEYHWQQISASSYQRFSLLRSLSVLDMALWDLVGKAKDEPVYRLLGGHCRERIPAYAGMLGFSTDPRAAAERSVEYVEKGFPAVKWYLPYNATAGQEGLARNVALIEAVREAVGDEVDIMLDCLLANPTENSLLWAISLARRIEPYRPAWLEEPLNFDDIEAHRRLAQATRIPLAFGEHWYSRRQFADLIASGAPTVLQPELLSCGGVTEMRKIITLASAYGIPVIPHANESGRMAAHVLFAQAPNVCPRAEWGVRLNHNAQFFYHDFYEPVNGFYELPPGPGMGLVLDESKVVERIEL